MKFVREPGVYVFSASGECRGFYDIGEVLWPWIQFCWSREKFPIKQYARITGDTARVRFAVETDHEMRSDKFRSELTEEERGFWAKA